MHMEYIVSSLHIATMTGMDDEASLEEKLDQLVHLEEDQFVVGFHQCVKKDQHKAWHDHHIKNKQFQQGELVLLYDSKFMKHPGKLQMHWLGPYIVNSITYGGEVQLQLLDGEMLPKLVNGCRLKPYRTGLKSRGA